MSRVARCAPSRDARAAPSDVAGRARRILLPRDTVCAHERPFVSSRERSTHARAPANARLGSARAKRRIVTRDSMSGVHVTPDARVAIGRFATPRHEAESAGVDVRARRATDRSSDARSRRFRATSDARARVDVGVARRAKTPRARARTRRRDGRESSIAGVDRAIRRVDRLTDRGRGRARGRAGG